MDVIVVTGASAGLGRAVARAWARRGAHVGLIGRGTEGLEAAGREVEAFGGRALVLPCDVADAGAVDASAARVEAELGPIDVGVNNATVSVFSPIHEMTAAEFRRVTEVTYLGYVHGTLTALLRMRPRDRGVIVQVGSALAYRGIPLQSAYCGAKHAIEGFTDSLRTELLHDASRVRVTTIHMPALNTPQFGWVRSRRPRKPQPVPPIYQPELGAAAVLFAVDSGRAEVWLGYPTVLAIIANRIAPRLVDRYLAAAGYAAQQTDTPVEPDRRDNLFAPVPGDRGAHGTFDARARRFSLQFWLTRHRASIASAAALGLVAFVAGRARARRRAA
jgi:NAD(P)-dependent dehydrogenase (short-subunit alcohol dehydrogenase family)